MDAYDVVIVGSGTGGQTAAYALREKGLTVAVVEQSESPGGTCALYGCQPKKFFYEAAETVARSRHLKGKGIETEAKGSWSSVREAKNRFTDKIPPGTREGFHEEGIDFLSGHARFLDKDILAVDGRPVRSEYTILATGAGPMPLPIPGNEHIINSDAYLNLENLPWKRYREVLGRIHGLKVVDLPTDACCRGRSEHILEKLLERNLSVVICSCNNCVRFLERKAGTRIQVKHMVVFISDALGGI